MKISIIYTNYGPYHFARLNAFHEICLGHGWQAIGIEFARIEKTYDWRTNLSNFPYQFISLNQEGVLEDIPLPQLSQQTFTCLGTLNPDVVVLSGYFHPGMLIALFWAKIHRKKAILLSVSKEDDFPRTSWKEFIKKILMSSYDAALVGGTPQKRYLLKLGFDENAIYCGQNVVNNEIYNPQNIADLPDPLYASPYFLSINRFVPKKNLINLLRAYADYHAKFFGHPWHLVLCGDGELRPQIEDLIKQFRLEKYVHLPGFLQQDELLPYFAHAKCFVHASTVEQWGLVVNEAMAAGLPVILSNKCGCYEDLLIDSVNGYGFDPHDQEQLTNIMDKISSNAEQARTMGEQALMRIQNYTPATFAKSLMDAVMFATN